jgi:hypothetical protein
MSRIIIMKIIGVNFRRTDMSSYQFSNLKTRRFAVMLGAMLGLFTLAVGLHARTRLSPPDNSQTSEVAAQGQGRRTTTTTNEMRETDSDSSETRIRYSDGEHSMEVKAREPLEFTDDDADIKSISRDGYLMIEEHRGSASHRFEVVPGADGRPQRSYFVGGQAQALDQDGRAWLAAVLPDVIRNTALGARARVQRIHRQRGAGGVLEEISLIHSDGAKRIYFQELFKSSNLDAATLRRAARQAASEIHSDGEKAVLLIESADLFLDQQSVSPDFFETIGSIHSDGEHRRVLSSILKKSLNDENILRTLKSARAIASDGEKATLLIQHADVFLNHPSSLQAFFDTTNSLNSSGEHARVLSAMLRRHELEGENLLRALRSAERIDSDGEKANVLIHAARAYASEPSALSAIADAAKTINSSDEKQRVLNTIARQGQRP